MGTRSKTTLIAMVGGALIALPLAFAVVLPLVVTFMGWLWRIPVAIVEIIASGEAIATVSSGDARAND